MDMQSMLDQVNNAVTQQAALLNQPMQAKQSLPVVAPMVIPQ